MGVSKATTRYSKEAQDNLERESRRIFKGEGKDVKEKKKKLTKRERITQDLEQTWLDYINKRIDKGSFLDAIVDYILKKK